MMYIYDNGGLPQTSNVSPEMESVLILDLVNFSVEWISVQKEEHLYYFLRLHHYLESCTYLVWWNVDRRLFKFPTIIS